MPVPHSQPHRDRRTSIEIVAVPAHLAPRVSWRARIILIGLILLSAGTAAVLWLRPPPRVDEDLAWEQIAPPQTVPMRPWRWIVLHHSASRSGDPQAFDQEHAQVKGWEGIGYHFVVGNGRPMPLGRIEATFRWRNQMHGAHAGLAAYNQEGVGICMVGDCDRQVPDEFQVQRLVELCAQLLDRVPTLAIARIVGHRDVPGRVTACPGRHLDVERVRFLVREEMVRRGMMVR